MITSAEPKLNLVTQGHYNMLRFHAQLLTTLVSAGGVEIAKDTVLEYWERYEKHCEGFIECLKTIYEAGAGEPLPEDKSVNFNIDYVNNQYDLKIHDAPFVVRNMALGTIELVLVRNALSAIL